jgi:hypothetical protein
MEELTTPKKKTNKIDYAITPISFYKFVCDDENIVSTYVGHTANFTRRKSGHKHSCNTDTDKAYNLKIYQTIRENGGWDKWKMIEIKTQFCDNKRHADRIEQELIEQYKSELNMCKAFGAETKKEYYKEYSKEYYYKHKQAKLEKQKHYRENNKDTYLEYQKQYCIKNEDKIKEYQQQWYIKNKEKISEQEKEYRLKNSVKIAERKRQYYLKKKMEKEQLSDNL